MARLAEQPAAWTHYLVGHRRKRAGGGADLPFPLNIPSLRLWLNADDIAQSDDTPVSAWADASGNGNDVSQATGMKMPTLKTGLLNGHSIVRLDGIDDTLFKLSASGFTCATGHTIIAVMNPTTAVGYGMAVVTKYQCNEMRQVSGGGIPEWMIPSGINVVDGWDDLTGLWKRVGVRP